MKLIPLAQGQCRVRHSPEAILQAVAQGGSRLQLLANQVVEDLCRCRYLEQTVYSYVLKNGGSRLKAEEVLEEGLIKLDELLRAGKYQGGKIEAFAIQVCKNLWLNMRRKKDEQHILSDDHSKLDSPEESTPETLLTEQERESALSEVLAACLGDDCRQILQLKFLDGWRHEKIAEHVGLANANSSKEKLNRCKQAAFSCISKSEKYRRLLQSVDIFIKKGSPHGQQ